MAEEGQGDRTEAATAHHLAQARSQGNVPISTEMTALSGLAAVTLVLAMAGPALGRHLAVRLQFVLAHIGDAGAGPAQAGHLAAFDFAMARMALLAGVAAAAPLVLAALAGGTLAILGQSGFALHVAALQPDITRLNPQRGIARLFGIDHVMEAGKSIIKILVLGEVAYQVLLDHVDLLRAAPAAPASWVLGQVLHVALHLLLLLLAAHAVMAVLDLLWVRLRHATRLRMSRQEIKDETKQTEGDPRIKARLRRLRLVRARRRMLAAVPKATVVVTNPTHYAIALVYDRGQQGAPRVVAKGVDEVAARIRDAARAHGVPLVANPPLARALFLVELEAEVPAEHFQAVAQLIAYVWRLRGRLRMPAAAPGAGGVA